MKKQILYYYFYAFFRSSVFQRAVMVLFLSDRGLNIAQIGILQAVYYGTNFISEVPTGFIGDHYGRKTSLIAGAALSSIVAISFLMFNNFGTYLVLMSLSGVAASFSSGSDSALLFDLANNSQSKISYIKVKSRANLISNLALGAAMICGGYLSQFSWNAVYLLTAASAASAAVTAIFFTENQLNIAKGQSLIIQIKTIFEEYSTALSGTEFRKMLPLITGGAILHSALTPSFIFGQKLFSDFKLSPFEISITFCALNLGMGVFGLFSDKISRILGLKKVYFLFLLLCTFCYAAFFFVSLPWAIAVFFFLMIFPEALINMLDTRFQEGLTDKTRASMLSTISLIEAISTSCSYYLFGLLIEKANVFVAFGWMAALPALALLIGVCNRTLFRENTKYAKLAGAN